MERKASADQSGGGSAVEKEKRKAAAQALRLKEELSRKKRALDIVPLLVHCQCHGETQENCIPDRQKLEEATNVCICYDRGGLQQDILWPCYRRSMWTETECICDTLAAACKPMHPSLVWPEKGFESSETRDTSNLNISVPCLCQNASYGCLKTTGDELSWWDPRSYPTYIPPVPTTTMDPNLLRKQGYRPDLKDEMTIAVLANENVVFAAAGLPESTRANISYTKRDLIIQCSFNGDECDLEHDFRLHLDAIFGNCFTFNYNYNESSRKFNSRAGPKYGLRVLINVNQTDYLPTTEAADVHVKVHDQRLRVLINVNQTDYLPTTEAAGVRVNVHDQRVESFPDTFGYSAPTGFVSSFGIKGSVLSRLDEPYGMCVQDGEKSDYMFHGRYSTEKCFRSCLQRMITSKCNCTDPRLPQVKGFDHCPVEGPKRKCVAQVTEGVDSKSIQKTCKCLRPCNESVYQVTYSAAIWPALRFNKGSCALVYDDPYNNMSCHDYYRENTAFVEVFYEQLNYEIKKEKEAYGTESLLADLGGNIGLWIGFSAITCVEWLLLFIEIVLYFCDTDRRRRTKRRRQFKKKSAASGHRASMVPPVIVNDFSGENVNDEPYLRRTTNF